METDPALPDQVFFKSHDVSDVKSIKVNLVKAPGIMVFPYPAKSNNAID